jgi:hypothetical protein
MGVNEGNERDKALTILKHVSHVDLTLITIVAFCSLHATCHIGSNTAELEGTPSFTNANLSLSFDQGKHLASSFDRICLVV